MSRMLLVFLTLGRRKEGCVQRPEPAGDVPPLARFSEQMQGPIDATREMQEAGAMAPPPLCPPNPGRPSLGGDAVQGGQQLIVKPWTRKGPQTLLSLQRSPHPSGTPPPWGGSFRRPPTDPKRTLRPAVHPQAFLWPAMAAGNKSGKNHLHVGCERCARDQTERGEKRPRLTDSAFGASPTAHTSIFWNWKSSWADS